MYDHVSVKKSHHDQEGFSGASDPLGSGESLESEGVRTFPQGAEPRDPTTLGGGGGCSVKNPALGGGDSEFKVWTGRPRKGPREQAGPSLCWC